MRRRGPYLVAVFVVLVCGLLTRPAARVLPPVFTSAVGDALWALLVYLLFAVVFPGWSRRRVFVAALLFSVAIECSQLYRAPWLQSLRQTTLGGLVLGYDFDGRDLLWYLAGVALGWVGEVLLKQPVPKE